MSPKGSCLEYYRVKGRRDKRKKREYHFPDSIFLEGDKRNNAVFPQQRPLLQGYNQLQ